MADACRYEAQLQEAVRLVSSGLCRPTGALVYQSRSGGPTQTWLEPDICDYLTRLGAAGQVRDVVIVPIGFISDHMEIIYDLDVQAREVCQRSGLNMVRASTVGTHPKFVRMIRDLIVERISGDAPRLARGELGPCNDVCPVDCCLPGSSGRSTGSEQNPETTV
jgi:ferrochelatase